jgi:hypothetical protein
VLEQLAEMATSGRRSINYCSSDEVDEQVERDNDSSFLEGSIKSNVRSGCALTYASPVILLAALVHVLATSMVYRPALVGPRIAFMLHCARK